VVQEPSLYPTFKHLDEMKEQLTFYFNNRLLRIGLEPWCGVLYSVALLLKFLKQLLDFTVE